MRKICATLMAIALLTATAAQADSTDTTASLAPGKAAGLKKAQDDSDNTIWFIVGAGAIAAGVALIVSGNSNNSVGAGGGSTGTTTSTQ